MTYSNGDVYEGKWENNMVSTGLFTATVFNLLHFKLTSRVYNRGVLWSFLLSAYMARNFIFFVDIALASKIIP